MGACRVNSGDVVHLGAWAMWQVKEKYMACLKQHANDSAKCMAVAKGYLECRMAK